MLLLSATSQAPKQIGAGMTLLGGNSVLLDPDAWIGEELPLLQFIDIGDELRSGVWNLLLYRPGCQDCEQALREINEQSDGAHTTAIIVVPPHTGDLSVGSLCTLGHLDPDYTWHITTPVAFELRDGLVSRRQAAGGFTNPSFNTLSSAQ